MLDDWCQISDFINLQFYLQPKKNSLVQGIFYDSSALYKHFWHQRALNLSNSFILLILEKFYPYIQEKWCHFFYCFLKFHLILRFCCDILKPIDITPSILPFIIEIKRLLEWINENISPDSILTIYSLINDEIWHLIDKKLISQTLFNYLGAAQIFYDITSSLIPLLNSLYSISNAVGIFDVILNEVIFYYIICFCFFFVLLFYFFL